MSFVFHPWQLLSLVLAGWVNHQQQRVIQYLRTENHVLKEKLGKKRVLLNDDQQRRLAVKGKVLGRKLLGEVGTLFTLDTILRGRKPAVDVIDALNMTVPGYYAHLSAMKDGETLNVPQYSL